MTASTVVYPGSFDPITLGHLDIITRASGLFQKVVVAVYAGQEGSYYWPDEERMVMAKCACKHLANVEVVSFSGPLAEWMGQKDYHCIIRGIRDGDDMSQEWRMAHSNQVLNPNIETIFLPASPAVSYVSSTLVRQVLLAGGDPSVFVPPSVIEQMGK